MSIIRKKNYSIANIRSYMIQLARGWSLAFLFFLIGNELAFNSHSIRVVKFLTSPHP